MHGKNKPMQSRIFGTCTLLIGSREGTPNAAKDFPNHVRDCPSHGSGRHTYRVSTNILRFAHFEVELQLSCFLKSCPLRTDILYVQIFESIDFRSFQWRLEY